LFALSGVPFPSLVGVDGLRNVFRCAAPVLDVFDVFWRTVHNGTTAWRRRSTLFVASFISANPLWRRIYTLHVGSSRVCLRSPEEGEEEKVRTPFCCTGVRREHWRQ
jgi:hypothetical protein